MAVPYPRGLTFEKVWAALMEDREQMKKSREEYDRLMKERREEFDRSMKERREEDDRRAQEAERRSQEADRRIQKLEEQIEKTSKIVGGLGNSIGELIETLFAARLWEKFSSYNYNFKRVYQLMPVYETNSSRMLTDIDILLSDSEWAMAVEVKRRMVKEDVIDHIERMDRILKHPPAEVKGKKLLGAMAGGTINPDALKLAYETGFFVLELKGESIDLLTPPEGFKPTEW